ncbi:MAG: hypothetical protein OXF62_17825 [Caldilineaceae bacterium]|nr:hypothetical protein [Caldilineaceae bacterium]
MGGGLSLRSCEGARIMYGGKGSSVETTLIELGSVISWSESPNRATGGGTQNDADGRSRTLPANRVGDVASMDVLVNFLPGNQVMRDVYNASRNLSERVWLQFIAREMSAGVSVSSSHKVAIASATGICTFTGVTKPPKDLAIGHTIKVGSNGYEVVSITDAGVVTVRKPGSDVSATAFTVVQGGLKSGPEGGDQGATQFQILTAPAVGDMTSDENAVYRGTITLQPDGDWPMMLFDLKTGS